MKHLLIFAFIAFVFSSCTSCSNDKPKKPAFYDTPENTSDVADDYSETLTDDGVAYDEDVVSIPFKEKGKVKYLPVTINGFGLEMIFDTGCSTTLISVSEARYLYEKGYLTKEDFKGTTQSQIADGSIVENMVVNLKEVVVGGKITCPNVEAVVSSNTQAPLLLGNEILDRTSSYSVDNENKVINFKIRR